ncbi:MAG: hypothetical protein ACP5OV_01795 [Acidimicrobiales bacterium]
MRPDAHSPRERDRRQTRARRVAQMILLGSGVASAAFVGYAAQTAPTAARAPAPPTTTTPAAGPTASPSTAGSYRPPTTAPVTTTTACYTTPSGSTVCS